MTPKPKVQVDPQVRQEQQRAEKERAAAVRDDLSAQTDYLVKLFGTRSALSGGSMKAPLFGA